MRMITNPHPSDITLENVLFALGDPLRMEVVRTLDMEGPLKCSILCGGRPKSSMSHHFRVLREAGVVRSDKQGTAYVNTLRREELEELFPGVLQAILAVPYPARLVRDGYSVSP